MQWTVAVGVDTHKDVHVAVAFDALGVKLGRRSIAATEAGYGDLLAWARGLGVPAFASRAAGAMALG
jgi:transposase